MGRRFSIRKLFLCLLVIVCLVIAGWTSYQLFFLHRLDLLIGSIILAVNIGVLIWNISILRSTHYKWKAPSFKLVFLPLLAIVFILAFVGVQPLARYKDAAIDKVGSWIEKGQEIIEVPEATKKADYVLFTKERGELHLSLVKQWKGEGDKVVYFSSVGPLVVDYWAVSKTSLSSDFSLRVGRKEVVGDYYWYPSDLGWYTGYGRSVVDTGSHYFIVDASGNFELSIESHGCAWEVRVGKVE